VHILAHDYGVSVAQELIARHMERAKGGDDRLEIRSTCFLNGGAASWLFNDWWSMKMLDTIVFLIVHSLQASFPMLIGRGWCKRFWQSHTLDPSLRKIRSFCSLFSVEDPQLSLNVRDWQSIRYFTNYWLFSKAMREVFGELTAPSKETLEELW